MYLKSGLPLIWLSTSASIAQAASCTDATFKSVALRNTQILSLTVTQAHNVTANGSLTNAYPSTTNGLEICQVTVLYTHPGQNDSINTWVWMPMTNWNGRLMHVGGGGFTTGTNSTLAQPVAYGYAGVSTDGGHDANTDGLVWGQTSPGNINWPNLQDFAAVALNEAGIIGKAVSNAFYGSPPKYSYFNGCSTGGRQGHMLAQRYPTQYNGILASAPAVYWNQLQMAQFWPTYWANTLGYYPSPCEIEAIAAAAIAACDGLDGVKDGIIAMPGLCHFDPMSIVGQTIQCTNPNGTIQITAKAAKIIAETWFGPMTVNGSFEWYGFNPGAPFEQGIAISQCVGSLNNCTMTPYIVISEWISALVEQNPTANLNNMTHEEFDRLFRLSINKLDSVIGTSDADLTDFKNAGGKMLTWHGTSDHFIPPNGTYDYYQRCMALDPHVADYYRFFPAPGVQHCGGGQGWFPGDAFQALVDWVEKGQAPTTLKAIATPSLPLKGGVSATTSATGPTRTVGLCMYPQVLTYVGGDPNVASSFTCK